jgi:hypothetical protein
LFIWRSQRIRDFLNGPKLSESLSKGRLEGIVVFDPAGRADSDDPQYQKFVHWTRPLRFSSVSVLYAGLMAFSLALCLLL